MHEAWVYLTARGVDADIAIGIETYGLEIMFEDWQGGEPLDDCFQDLANYDSSSANTAENFWNINKYKISGAGDLTRGN